MNNNSFRFSQKVIGQERKAIASVIAEAIEARCAMPERRGLLMR